MRVVKEAWLLENLVVLDSFMCMQNTATPKLYVTEKSAKSAAEYHGTYYNNGIIMYKPIKAFLVVDDSTDQIEIPF